MGNCVFIKESKLCTLSGIPRLLANFLPIPTPNEENFIKSERNYELQMINFVTYLACGPEQLACSEHQRSQFLRG